MPRGISPTMRSTRSPGCRRSPRRKRSCASASIIRTVTRLVFGFHYLINYVSTFTTLVPGDVIVTGTPTGAGARFDPPHYLKPGDVIEVEAENIGVLRNGVIDEAR